MLPSLLYVLALHPGCASRLPVVAAPSAELATPDTLVYQVGFTWTAARGLGWGSWAAPVLARIDEVPWVREAWLSPDGNMLVVSIRDGMRADGAVVALVEEAGRPAVFLTDVNRDSVLAMFQEREGWVRSTTAQSMTAQEADLVAERIARRVEAVTPLAGGTRVELVNVVRERFFAVYDPQAVVRSEEIDLVQRIVEDAKGSLTMAELKALEAALALGFGPLDEEE